MPSQISGSFTFALEMDVDEGWQAAHVECQMEVQVESETLLLVL